MLPLMLRRPRYFLIHPCAFFIPLPAPYTTRTKSS
jgi:hypothetical protein